MARRRSPVATVVGCRATTSLLAPASKGIMSPELPASLRPRHPPNDRYDRSRIMTASLPSRLHHTAYVCKDLEATRHFYEDILGFPLVATWCEQEELFGKERTYCHCFFGLADGSALAFFQFAEDSDQREFGPELASSPFRHVALNVDQETQAELEKRIKDAGLEATYVLEHGYCRSVYV